MMETISLKNLKKRILNKILLLLMSFILIEISYPLAYGEEGVLSQLNLEASGSIDFYSQYVWRGFALDTDPVVQPGFSISGYGFTFSFWSSWDADNNDSLNSDEIDYTLDYTKEFDNFSISVGHTYYDFPGTNSYSKEFYVGLGLPNLPLSPGITYYHDYGDEENGGGDGDYVVLEISHSFTLIEEPAITFDLGAHVGYNNELFINGGGGDFLISAGFTIPLTENLTFSPSVNYSVPFGDLEDTNDGAQKNRFYSGFSLAYTF